MFDVMKYKENIIDAAHNALVEEVSVREASLRGECEPTFYVGCWLRKDAEEIRSRFVRSICHTVTEDVDWLIVVVPPDMVRDMGASVIKSGEWCYG